MGTTIITLVVAVYSAIPDFDVRPHAFATFVDRETCEAAARQIEARSTKGRDYVALCAREVTIVNGRVRP